MSYDRLRAGARAVQAAMDRATGSRPIPGNRVELLFDGPAAYPAMLEVIAGARRWIHFENYIIRSDESGWRFATALAARAREGVAVRVLYDWVGSLGTSRRYWRFLRRAGVEVRSFHPPHPTDLVTNLSRDHRKLVAADGTRAVTGGLCIGDEWTGARAPDGQPWRDTAVAVDGPAAAVLDRSFAAVWEAAGGSVPAEHRAAEVREQGGAEVRVIVGEPGRERAYRVIELLASGCSERLWITDAYLVAPPRLFQVLRDTARDGVDVRLLLPGSSDVPFVRNLTRIGYRDLLAAGVRIFEWSGPMLHAKTIAADNRWVRVGSSNLNAASLIGNYELDVLIEDRAVADALERQFRFDSARSPEVSRRPVRAPPALAVRLPAALTHLDPEAPVPHEGSRHELRRRRVLALRTLAANARRSVFLPVTAGLGGLAVLFLVLPRVTAFAFAVLCAWLAVAAGREAFRRRAR